MVYTKGGTVAATLTKKSLTLKQMGVTLNWVTSTPGRRKGGTGEAEKFDSELWLEKGKAEHLFV